MRKGTTCALFSSFSMLISTLLLMGCNSDGAGCFDKAGDIKTISVDVSAFKIIDVTSNVDVQILTSGVDRVEVTVGENLFSGIDLQVVDDVLKIDNLNSCYWARGYTKPLVSVRNTDLEQIIQHGYGDVYSTDTLNIEELKLVVEDASGAINLLINATTIRVVSNNIGPITLSGSANSLNAGVYWSDGVLNASKLKVENCSVNHNGSNNVEVNVTNQLTGLINSLGNIYLFGQAPTTVDVAITGDGKVIEKY